MARERRVRTLRDPGIPVILDLKFEIRKLYKYRKKEIQIILRRAS